MNAKACLNLNDCDRASGLQYQALDTVTQVEAVSLDWDRLLDRSRCNRVFSCSKWFLGACDALKLVPRVFVASRGNETAAILPLVLQGQGRCLDFATQMSDYNDMVADPADLAAQAGLLRYTLTATVGCELELSNVRPDSNCLQAANFLAKEGLFWKYEPGKNCFYVRLAGGFDQYLASRSRAFRKGLNRIRRNANSNGLAVCHFSPASIAASELPEVFLSLNMGRFQDTSGFRSERAQSFVRSVFPALFAEGRVTAFGLIDRGRIVAIDLCMRGAQSLCSWNGGFLEEAAQWSPGRLLLAAEIEHAFAAGLQEYDLLRGSHPYKASWATDSRSIGKLTFRAQSCRVTPRQDETKSTHCLQR